MQLHSSIKFHWSSYPDEILPESAEFIDLCRCAEACGFESVHVPAPASLSDSLALAMLTGLHTTHLKFRIGWNFDRILATLCGREMKEAWTNLQGRLIFHMSFGTEGVTADAYYPQAQEFLMNCRRL